LLRGRCVNAEPLPEALVTAASESGRERGCTQLAAMRFTQQHAVQVAGLDRICFASPVVGGEST